MPVPDIHLTKPLVMLSQSSSGLGIEPNDSSFLFGLVVLQYETSPNTVTGYSVLFNPKQAQAIIKYGNDEFYIIEESKIIFRETVVP